MNFWEGKKVFITGHTGFKGAWLTLMLHHLGAKVTGLSLDVPTEPSVFELTKASEVLVQDLRGDIRDFEKLNISLKKSEAEIVFHLAAQSLVRKSYAEPALTFETNVMGTLNVLLACKNSQVRSIVVATSDKCYENLEGHHRYSEDDSLGGHDPYSSSKACAEILSTSVRSSYLSAANIHMSTVRAGNVIGGGDWAMDRLVADFMRSYLGKEKLVIRYPHAVRPWQHVMDPLKAYILLAEKNYSGPEFSEPFNIGSDETFTVTELINGLRSHFPDHDGIQFQENEKLHESELLLLDSKKLKEKLEWRPKYKIEEAIRLTCDWYRAQFDGKNMREVTLKQIRDFLS